MHRYVGFSYHSQLKFPSSGMVCSSEVGVSRRQVLEKVDVELAKGDERAALLLVRDLQGKSGGLRCFGSARQVSLWTLTPQISFFFSSCFVSSLCILGHSSVLII